jgi:S-DNA-T family DNA segregation ATPase FtsK/SpoIIIE
MRSQIRLSKSVSLQFSGDGTVRRLLKRNLSAIAGLTTLALVAAIAASLATWAVDDPSLSHAADRSIRNVLGYPGAIVSDLLTQLFGLAASVVLIPPIVWGWRAVFANPTRLSLKTTIAWMLGSLVAALALATIPVPGSWPLPTGLGGGIGDRLLKVPAIFIGQEPSGFAALASGAISASLALLLVFYACGMVRPFERNAPERDDGEPEETTETRSDRRTAEDNEDLDPEAEDAGLTGDDDRPSRLALAFGLLQHLVLLFFAWLRRLLGRRRAGRDEFAQIDDNTADGWRVEPRLGADGEWYAPAPVADGADIEADADIADESEDEEAPARPKKRKARATPRKRTIHNAFQLPPLTLLAEPKAADRKATVSAAQLEQNARDLEGVLEDFGVKGEIINVRPGPVVTLYELEPAPGIKSSRVIGLADDIARSMSAIACRVAVIPGKNAIGIELPNARRETVFLRELIDSEDFTQSKARLGLCLGKTIGGEPVIADLARMPHLLVAGTTGSGKSVSINTMILSLLYRWTPAECRLIMIDPKMLELSTYDGIPHLLTPVVTDPKQAIIALKWTVREMEDRYRKMSKLGVRNIDGYNARLAQALAKGETLTRTVQTGFDPDTGEAVYEKEALSLDPMPFIVVIIDEMADLMMVAGKDIEGAVQRLAQMARAAGIHVVMATQRPSVDVITGTIKANFPTRISFQVTSKIDSRTILGEQGAEQLLGQGDMLYMMGGGRITRVHGPFVSDREVEEVVSHLKEQGAPEYLHAVTVDEGPAGDGFDMGEGIEGEESNDLYDKAVAIVLRDRKASTSYIQRRLAIGYNRAASIIEKMEQEGVVGPANHAGKREILVPEDGEAAFR